MIHQYKLLGYNIVLDAYSGSVHVVDDLAYDIIAMYESVGEAEIIAAMSAKYANRADVTREELIECIGDIRALKQRGKLFAPDTFSELASDFKRRQTHVKALCLHVAHVCNLKCAYCFAGQGKYRGAGALMSYDTGKQALEFLIAHSGNHVNLEVDFFGGEPLMNWDTVKRLVYYARGREKETGKRFRFTLTTNGVLIDDDVIDFANKEMRNVVLSLDGRKHVHDHFRVNAQGLGSYDTVVPKFLRLVEKRGGRDYYVRGTFTHMNTDFTRDILHMADLGFTQLSMEPVVCKPGDPYALTREDMPVLLEQYELLAKEMLKRERGGRPFTFYHYMIDLANGPCAYKRASGCGSGAEYMAVTPAGELFPCHQFVGDAKYSLGNVYTGVTNPSAQEEFKLSSAYSRPECADCWAKLYCSGGCAANAYRATGRVLGVYEYGCELFKKRIECAIMLKAAQAREAD